MLQVVERYKKLAPGNRLTPYIAALSKVNGTSSQDGLGQAFEDVWRSVGCDPKYRAHFREAQDQVCDVNYFGPAVDRAQRDGLQTLGQFIYYDALVMHGEGKAPNEFDGIRTAATKKQRTPADGGDETKYLHAFLDARKDAMLMEEGHKETARVDTMQRIFLILGNLELNLPLTFKVNEETFTIPW